MSFNSFNLEAPPVTPSNNMNKSVFPTPSPCTTSNFLTYSALDSDTFCFMTPLRISTASIPNPSHSQGSKRRKENEPLSDQLPSLNRPFAEFIYLVSRHKDENNQPSMIVECWYQSADGRASASGSIPMFATSPVYTEIKPARAGLTAFAAQIVERELVREAREVVKPSSGLHATSKKRGSQRLEWVDIGTLTVRRVEEIYKDIQSLTTTNIRKLKRTVFPAPVAIVAMTSSPSKDRQIPSH